MGEGVSKSKDEKLALKRERKLRRKKKKNALVMCRDGKEFWTTQDQFWQWVRERVVVKAGDTPLRGHLVKENEEYAVILANTVLNLRCPNHLAEAMHSRKYRVN